MIYGICADIVAMEMEYLFSSEGLRDLRGVGVDQVDRAAVPRCHETTARGWTRLESVVLGAEPCIVR